MLRNSCHIVFTSVALPAVAFVVRSHLLRQRKNKLYPHFPGIELFLSTSDNVMHSLVLCVLFIYLLEVTFATFAQRVPQTGS